MSLSKSNKNKSASKKKSDTKEGLPLSLTPGIERPKVKVPNASTPNLSVVPLITTELKDNSNLVKDIEVQRKKRIKVEPSIEVVDTTVTKGSTISIEIPSLLKESLVEDWERINEKKLVRLPAKVTVNRIIEDYLKLKLNQRLTPTKESAIREAAEGIKEYFNASVATKLLYDFEKNQIKDLIKDPEEDPKPSTIYGGIHLLRLFGILSIIV